MTTLTGAIVSVVAQAGNISMMDFVDLVGIRPQWVVVASLSVWTVVTVVRIFAKSAEG